MSNSRGSLEARLGYTFTDGGLLEQALTHRSFASRNNERLEFLGDSVFNCVVGLMLYQRFPQLPEGRLSRLRANLVNQHALYDIALGLDLGGDLRLGEGEVRSGGRERPSILADALESILGAVFLDGGFESVRRLIEGLLADKVAAIDPSIQGKDAKTRLQEWLQCRHHVLPGYTLLEVSGQAHAQTFTVACAIEALNIATRGSGNSRKAAEQQAAQAALKQLEAG